MAPAKIFNVFAIAGSHAVNAFYTQLLIPVLPLIVAEFELNYVQAGLIVTTYSAANSVFQFPLSFISDYTRRWRTVLALSLLTQALPVLLYGYAESYSLLLLFVFIGGIGSAAYHPPAVALITRELPGRRGFCTGLFNGGGEMGNIISPAIVGWLAVYLSSWRMAAQFYVIPGVIWAALIWFRFQDQMGERLPFRQAARSTFSALFGNKPLMLLIALSSFRIMGFRGFMAFLPLLLAEQFGFDTKGVGWLLSAYFLIGSTMSILIGRWSDNTGRTRLIVVLTFMCATAMATLTWVSSLTTLLACAFRRRLHPHAGAQPGAGYRHGTGGREGPLKLRGNDLWLQRGRKRTLTAHRRPRGRSDGTSNGVQLLRLDVRGRRVHRHLPA